LTRKSIGEYAEAVRQRYVKARKKEKSRILDEFCQTTGYNRKSAIRLLSQPSRRIGGRRGRPRKYGFALAQVLKRVWEVSDKICSKRLAPFIGELVSVLERHGEIELSAEVRQQLVQLKPATIDRLLRPHRSRGLSRSYSQSRSSSALKAKIPIRTFGDWENVRPGSLQADLVFHSGESLGGFHLTTLCGVDVATGWTECEAVWGKQQGRVGSGLHKIRQRLPFDLFEFHTDNGGEFINEVLYPWCKREGIKFTRGRPYKKNDQAWVEQKNWTVVRRLVGYDRFSSKEEYEQLKKVYGMVRLYTNFFQPMRKLIGKERVGAKVRKRFDEAKTPYKRVMAAGVLKEGKRKELEGIYERLNPVELRRQIDEALEELWSLASRKAKGALALEATEGRAVG
jgi:hypothetical protein